MTTMTDDRPARTTRASLPTLLRRVVSVMNAAEQERRREVNSHHFGRYGRVLYPEGGQYAHFDLGTAIADVVPIMQRNDGGNGPAKVHAYVDLRTGDVLTPRSTPTRFNLRDGASLFALVGAFEFTGRYLYTTPDA